MDLDAIKTALKAAGLSEDLADKIKVNSQEELDAEVKRLKEESEKLPPKDFLDAAKRAGFEKELLAHIQSENDKRVTEAIKTHDKKLKETAEETAKREQEEKERLEKEKTMTPYEKELETLKADFAQKDKERDEKFEKLTGMFKEFMGKDKADKLDVLKDEALKEAGLPTKYKDLLTVEDESKLEERIKIIKEGFAEQKEKEVETWVKDQKTPFQSKGKSVSSKVAEVKEYIKETQDQSGQGAASEQLGLTKE